ncbi:aminotransferase class I/II-fold pyridoxal phosphate-dependent enzyme [Candidatus Fokinia crypta]|uniref:5-aminolevulinate synthase n=1 Tax=Candidatus Fokinia crypta TaxID=1920990 RepID=A0ABZ0UP29_9RICK|nr:8-amino-7-oxononanoate synthase [Candidatus Fokinia cryptica]WPX97885.1 8-amino-7-oxononanoate synthase [Candidatus Fokinia cryptica]
MYKLYKEHLLTLHDNNKHRTLNTQERNINFLDFSTNDYLNLSKNNEVINAAITSAQKYGVGSTGSRLLSGNLPLYEEFEEIIAKDKNTESSLLFSSGFQANVTALSSLLDEKVLQAKALVFFDKLNHSSLYQAVFLSKAELCRYHHCDIQHLESLLENYKEDLRPKFIVTETIFGMDGDIAPLKEIVEIATKYKAFLYLDEAHATGIFGKNGYGFSTTIQLDHIPHVVMGTFSKAIGCSGGYIASHKVIIDFLINKATGFVYSTAPSPHVIGAALIAWKMIKSLQNERSHLQNLGNILRAKLKEYGFDTGASTTHIIPIILKGEKICLQIQDELLKQKIIVSGIRPPTVPYNSSRLRIALTSKHQLQDVERLVNCLKIVIS